MVDGGVEQAVLHDLDGMPDSLKGSALAATALTLGQSLDAESNSATSKSMCARALLEILDRLRALAPAEKTDDRVDELGKRRAKRLSA